MKRQPTITDIIMLAGGAITFLFSFFEFFKDGASAWGGATDGGAFPVGTIPAILGLAMVVLVLVEWFSGPTFPKILTFDLKQIYVTFGVTAAAMMLAWLIFDLDKGIGAIIMLLGSLAMAAGAILNILGIATNPLTSPKAAAPGYPGGYPAQPGQPGYPAQPGQYPPQQGGYPPQPGYDQPPAQGYPPAGQAPPPPPVGGPGAPPPPPPG